MGELPNSHGRTLTDESYVMHGILSGTFALRDLLEQLNRMEKILSTTNCNEDRNHPIINKLYFHIRPLLTSDVVPIHKSISLF